MHVDQIALLRNDFTLESSKCSSYYYASPDVKLFYWLCLSCNPLLVESHVGTLDIFIKKTKLYDSVHKKNPNCTNK